MSNFAVDNRLREEHGSHLILYATLAGSNIRFLLDNGCTDVLLNKSFARAHRKNIQMFPLDKPIPMTLGDGSFSQKITHAALVDLAIGRHKEQAFCYVAKLGTYPLILGDAWLQLHNPLIDWNERSVRFSHPRCFEAGCLRAKPHKEYAIGCRPKQDKAKPRPDIHVCSARTFLRLC